MKKPRVILADDHTFVLEGFKKLLEMHCELVASVEDGRALIDATVKLKPDLVILDISMPKLNGIEAAKKLKKQVPAVKLIFVTMHAEMAYVDAAFRIGASGYLLKRSATTELMQAVESVMSDKFYVTPLITKEVVTSFLMPTQTRAATVDDLTTRQHEILQLVAEGLSAKEIADQLKISHRTVEFHKTKIMEHLNVHSTPDLVKYAVTHGLVTTL
ncbi:MAG TPA: response regulator transcription factor [Nitrospira sp.]|nr:response regulator transcription factor [Nitrospira sp.]